MSESPPLGFTVGFVDVPPPKDLFTKADMNRAYRWTDAKGRVTRRTINYGWDFVAMEENKSFYREVPEGISLIRKKLAETFSSRLPEGTLPESFDNIIVTFYGPGQFIDPHCDRDGEDGLYQKMRRHIFGESIIGVILEPDRSGCLSFYYHEGPVKPSFSHPVHFRLPEKAGSAFLMQGASRHRPYYHGIPPVLRRRVSLTMRQVRLVHPE